MVRCGGPLYRKGVLGDMSTDNAMLIKPEWWV